MLRGLIREAIRKSELRHEHSKETLSEIIYESIESEDLDRPVSVPGLQSYKNVYNTKLQIFKKVEDKVR